MRRARVGAWLLAIALAWGGLPAFRAQGNALVLKHKFRAVPRPEGTFDSSPALQCWEDGKRGKAPRPGGTIKTRFRGLRFHCPYGTTWFLPTSGPSDESLGYYRRPLRGPDARRVRNEEGNTLGIQRRLRRYVGPTGQTATGKASATPAHAIGFPRAISARASPDEAFHTRTRAAIREVLAQREYADLQADENVFWQRLFGRIFDMVGRIFAPLTHLAPWILWTIVIWMLLTLAAILGHLIYVLVKLVEAPLQTAGGGRSAGGRPQDLLGIRDLDFDAVYAQAGRLVSAGDWAAATRYLYVAAILWLDRQGRIAFRSSKTNRDYLEELQPAARQQELFRRLTGRFEPIVYGGQAATKSSTDDMTSSVEGLFHGPTGTLAG